MGELILFLGGAKSGKTRLAQARADSYPAPRVYLATAEALDEEMAQRIKNHQAERGAGWTTLEVPAEPEVAIAGLGGQCPLMLDCITLWLSNLMGLDGDISSGYVVGRMEKLAEAAKKHGGPVIVVSNELGGGLVPMNAMARKFRDLAGLANQCLAAEADEVYLVTAGLPLKLK